MPILNYTTSIAVEKTAGEIQKKLAAAKASAVLTEYDDDAVMVAMSFRINSPHGVLSFLLPARIDGVYRRLQDQGVPRKLQTREQAEQAELAEVFLPYLQDPSTGETVYKKLSTGGFKQLTCSPESPTTPRAE